MKVLELLQLLMEIDGNLPSKFDSNLLAKIFKLFLIFVGPICTLLSIIAFCIVNADDFAILVVTMYNIIGVSHCISLNISFCCQSNSMQKFITKLSSIIDTSK